MPYLAAYGKRRDTSSGAASRTQGKSASAWYAKQRSGMPIRFLSPHERLPKGLPEWFVRKDANGDGQVSMSEFSSSWTSGKRQEFNTSDKNRDGFIVPGECLPTKTSR